MSTFSVDPLSEFNLKHIVPIEVEACSAHRLQLNVDCSRGNMALDSCTQTAMLRCALIIACVFVIGALAGSQDEQRPKISDEALERALNDKRYLQRQLKCALGEASCDPVGRRLKTLAPLVLRGSCPQCTPDEMRQIQRTLSHIQRNYPKEWNKIVKQYAGF
ncbi:ejaculatory bulb-specific protein 3-like [Zootermopsis nevadensis]|uniref:Odorant-binding protein A10 n=1 Tax=Zootermopsis nevadensis TaxID=136037 RepID=A0A067RHW6_ZOONE|nr:ejaculatory bulb-specific protein 3-like [Zootermopsis nevadensis]KDR23456.1 hypothetical protein L798_08658 [Zootermopsis nevadensis]